MCTLGPSWARGNRSAPLSQGLFCDNSAINHKDETHVLYTERHHQCFLELAFCSYTQSCLPMCLQKTINIFLWNRFLCLWTPFPRENTTPMLNILQGWLLITTSVIVESWNVADPDTNYLGLSLAPFIALIAHLCVWPAVLVTMR